MRILTISPYFFPSEGGGERAVYNLSKEYVKKGHEVVIATLNCLSYGLSQSVADKEILSISKLISIKSAQLPLYEVLDGLTIYRFPYVAVKYPFGSLPFSSESLILSPLMLSVLMRSKPDIVHMHGSSYFYQKAFLAALSRLRNTPYVLTVHGLHEFYHYTYMQTRFIIRSLLHRIVSYVYKGAKRIIALSELDKPLIKKFNVLGDRISVIPNGVELNKYQTIQKESLNRIREKYNMHEKVGLTVAAIKPSKGIEYLVDAVARMKDTNASFLIVGDHIKYPKYVSEIQKRINKFKLQDRIILTGWLPENELSRLYHTADFFVLPTLTDTSPLVILEALAAGKPVIATNVGGISELVKNFENGILVSPKDSNAISNAIEILLDDELRRRLSINAKKTIGMEYSWQKIAEKTLKLYDEVLELT